MVSPITTLRPGLQDNDYTHVESFRRQVYVTPPQEDYVLLSSIVITYEDTYFRIFLIFDDMKCFVYKQAGYTATKCFLNAKQLHSESLIQTTTCQLQSTPLQLQENANQIASPTLTQADSSFTSAILKPILLPEIQNTTFKVPTDSSQKY